MEAAERKSVKSEYDKKHYQANVGKNEEVLMGEGITKSLSEIGRSEWIAFRWVEAPEAMGDDERTFMSDGKRTPTEAAQAAEEWDFTAEERAEFKDA